MQMKYLDKGGGASGSPIVTVTLRSGDKHGGAVLAGRRQHQHRSTSPALHDKWLIADMTMKIAPAGTCTGS